MERQFPLVSTTPHVTDIPVLSSRRAPDQPRGWDS